MELLQWLTGIAISVALLSATIQLVRRRQLREEHALLWLAACGTIFLLSLFPTAAHFLASLFAVTYPPTLLLVLGLLFALAILLSHSVLITNMVDHKRDLAQSLAILEWEVRQVEGRLRTLSSDLKAATPTRESDLERVAPL